MATRSPGLPASDASSDRVDFTHTLMPRVAFALMKFVEARFVDAMLYAVRCYVLFNDDEASSCFWHRLLDDGGSALCDFQNAIHATSLKGEVL